MDRKLADAFEHAPAPLLLTTPDGAVLRANAAACRLLGHDEEELQSAGGFHFDGELSVSSFERADGERLAVVVLRDPTTAPGEADPFHDALTGLPSRLLFEEHLGLALARSEREHTAVAVLHVDLDGFGQVNEVFGREVADEVLRRVAQRLEASARLSDVVARVDGDEFLVLVGDLGRRVCVPAAEGIALRVEDALSSPFDVDGEIVACAASVGLALYPKQVRSAGELVDAAGAALQARRRERRDAAA